MDRTQVVVFFIFNEPFSSTMRFQDDITWVHWAGGGKRILGNIVPARTDSKFGSNISLWSLNVCMSFPKGTPTDQKPAC